MSQLNRRELLAGAGVAGMVGCARPPEREQPKATPLDLSQYQPKSMLHVPETEVPQPRFPVIDIHTHLTWSDDVGEKVQLPMPPEELLEVMESLGPAGEIPISGSRSAGRPYNDDVAGSGTRCALPGRPSSGFGSRAEVVCSERVRAPAEGGAR